MCWVVCSFKRSKSDIEEKVLWSKIVPCLFCESDDPARSLEILAQLDSTPSKEHYLVAHDLPSVSEQLGCELNGQLVFGSHGELHSVAMGRPHCMKALSSLTTGRHTSNTRGQQLDVALYKGIP